MVRWLSGSGVLGVEPGIGGSQKDQFSEEIEVITFQEVYEAKGERQEKLMQALALLTTAPELVMEAVGDFHMSGNKDRLILLGTMLAEEYGGEGLVEIGDMLADHWILKKFIQAKVLTGEHDFTGWPITLE